MKRWWNLGHMFCYIFHTKYLPSRTSAATKVINDPVTYCTTVYGMGPANEIANPKHVINSDAKRICLQEET